MRILIVRHGDPDYEKDSLTERGWREAEILSERLCKLDIKAFYVSPLGRAKDTASFTLERMNRTAEVMPWMREFGGKIMRPDVGRESIAWDWLPADWTEVSDYYDKDKWCQTEIMQQGRSEHGDIRQEYQWIAAELDKLLARHGYVRERGYYRVCQANRDTIVMFCHFGLECVLLSHMLGVSPMVLWHGFRAAPTSVTTIYTEERREGIAYFRVSGFGDISHLYAAGVEPAFSARFCECYDNREERHD